MTGAVELGSYTRFVHSVGTNQEVYDHRDQFGDVYRAVVKRRPPSPTSLAPSIGSDMSLAILTPSYNPLWQCHVYTLLFNVFNVLLYEFDGPDFTGPHTLVTRCLPQHLVHVAHDRNGVVRSPAVLEHAHHLMFVACVHAPMFQSKDGHAFLSLCWRVFMPIASSFTLFSGQSAMFDPTNGLCDGQSYKFVHTSARTLIVSNVCSSSLGHIIGDDGDEWVDSDSETCDGFFSDLAGALMSPSDVARVYERVEIQGR